MSVIEVSEFNSEAICDLRCCLEATMTQGVTKMTPCSNVHTDTMVIEAAEFKSEVIFALWGHWGCLEAAMASEATKKAVINNVRMDTRVINIGDFKCEVKFDIWDHLGHDKN